MLAVHGCKSIEDFDDSAKSERRPFRLQTGRNRLMLTRTGLQSGFPTWKWLAKLLQPDNIPPDALQDEDGDRTSPELSSASD